MPAEPSLARCEMAMADIVAERLMHVDQMAQSLWLGVMLYDFEDA